MDKAEGWPPGPLQNLGGVTRPQEGPSILARKFWAEVEAGRGALGQVPLWEVCHLGKAFLLLGPQQPAPRPP